MNSLGVSYIKLAKEMKLSAVEVAKGAVDLYRQGLTNNEVENRLKHAARYAKVTGMSMENAVEVITVAINTGLVKTAQRATDVLVKLGDAAATDSRMVA